MDTIRIMVVEDHQIVREGLRRIRELEPDMRVVAEAANADEAIRQVRAVDPDVILMDIKMPGMDGIELTRRLTKDSPELKILVLTLYDEYLTEAIAAGAIGFLQKDLGRGELAQAIRTANEGRSPLYLSLERDSLMKIVRPEGGQEVFSERETSIMRCVAGGAQGKEIEEKRERRENKGSRTLREVFDKLGVRNSSEAVAEALKRHLI